MLANSSIFYYPVCCSLCVVLSTENHSSPTQMPHLCNIVKVCSSLVNHRMASRSWCKIILLLVVLAGLLHRAAAECLDQSQSCDECYNTLAKSLVNTRNNKYELRRVFYPLRRASPVFVTVTYQYNDSSVPDQTWYWGAGVFYFFQPLEVFQFTSLFFGNPEWRSSELTLILPAQCAGAPEEFMTELTEQVRTPKKKYHDLVVVFLFGVCASQECLYGDKQS